MISREWAFLIQDLGNDAFVPTQNCEHVFLLQAVCFHELPNHRHWIRVIELVAIPFEIFNQLRQEFHITELFRGVGGLTRKFREASEIFPILGPDVIKLGALCLSSYFFKVDLIKGCLLIALSRGRLEDCFSADDYTEPESSHFCESGPRSRSVRRKCTNKGWRAQRNNLSIGGGLGAPLLPRAPKR